MTSPGGARRGRITDSRAKAIGFFVLVAFLMTHSWRQPWWWVAVGLVGAAWFLAGLSWARLGDPLRRMKWLLIGLIGLHAFLTPGHALLGSITVVTREGLLSGLEQASRLLLLAGLAWALVVATPPRQLVAALPFQGRLWGGLGRGLRRGAIVLLFALGRLSAMIAQAQTIGRQLLLRLGWRPLSVSGHALLLRTLREIDRREEALRSRGFGRGLPDFPDQAQRWAWRETVAILASTLPWIGAWFYNAGEWFG